MRGLRHNMKKYSSPRKSAGQMQAQAHVRAAKEFTRYVGGTDEDVKKYFFALQPNELNKILNEYEKKYSRKAREYAEQTLPNWKNGSTKMSGDVAKRLYNLLPPTMQLETKFKLVDSLWEHVGPSTSKEYTVNIDASVDAIVNFVRNHMERVVVEHEIPETLENRFNWLSQNDVAIKQQLLNHFRQQEKNLLSNGLRSQITILKNHLNSEKSKLTNYVTLELRVGKHAVCLNMKKKADRPPESKSNVPAADNNNWIWWIIGIIILLFLLA